MSTEITATSGDTLTVKKTSGGSWLTTFVQEDGTSYTSGNADVGKAAQAALDTKDGNEVTITVDGSTIVAVSIKRTF